MLPRKTIRSNSNCIILFKQPNADLRHLHDDIVSIDMPWEEFHKFCNDTW